MPRCRVCAAEFIGMNELMFHAKETGHGRVSNKDNAIRLIESALLILKSGGDGSEILLRSALDELSLSAPSPAPSPATPTKTGYAPHTEAPERPVKSAVKRPVQTEKVPKMAPTISSEELTPEMRDYIGRIIDFLLTRDEMKEKYVIICGSVSALQFKVDGKTIKSMELLNRIVSSEISFSKGDERYKIQKVQFDENQSHDGYGLVRA